MARNGVISPKVYLQRAYERNIDLENAKRAVVDALQMDKLVCKGLRRISAIYRLQQTLQRSDAQVAEPNPRKPEVIPANLWIGLSEGEIAEWDWENGRFVSTGDLDPQEWSGIKLNEKQCNELLTRLQARLPASPNTENTGYPVAERRRGVTWDDWVAAVATLAYEHQIDVNSTYQDILHRAAIRLDNPHEPDKRTSRMKTAALAIVTRWKTKPPREPAPVTHQFNDPT